MNANPMLAFAGRFHETRRFFQWTSLGFVVVVVVVVVVTIPLIGVLLCFGNPFVPKQQCVVK